MAASISGAIKGYLETKGLGLSFYKDIAPQQAQRPYGIIHEGIGLRLPPIEDGGPSTGMELVQLDLWQTWLKSDKTVTEDSSLADRVTRAIHGARLLPSGTSAPPSLVYGVIQQGRLRILDRNNNLVQYAFTLAVHRVI